MSSLEQHRLRYRKKHLEVTPGVSFDDEIKDKDEPRYNHRRGQKSPRQKGKDKSTGTVLEINDSMGESDPITCATTSPSQQCQPQHPAANGEITNHPTAEESSSLPNPTANHSAPGTQHLSSDIAPGERDITSSDNAHNDQSSLSIYLDNLGKMHRDALERMYSIAVAPCIGTGSSAANLDHPQPTNSSSQKESSRTNNLFSGVCLESGGALDEPLGYLNCSFPQFALVDHNSQPNNNGDGDSSIGSAIGWRKCEYCACASVTNCGPTCQRPKLYFLKQKPPFCSPDGWDPDSEYPMHPFGTTQPDVLPLVTASSDTSQISTLIPEKNEQESNHNTSWMSGFF
uniref:Uncharacterized protein n=1 Tax=Attheya septentrionalis TaxID=420275 RepID=A0A7S2UNC0_9STRA|mmetsp:Transcript_5766/g.10211  ORF Transcript_5766/g.10211 Transcript_5766/m.10211 type:complete len:343 (+) Transcript_5766:135-1163(+)